jgi:hypothetical protein
MLDGLGTTVYSYTAAGQLFTEDGPSASDTVTNLYLNRLRTALGLQRHAGNWTNGFAYDLARRLTNVVSPVASNYNVVPSGPLIGANGTNYQSNFTYDGLGRLRKRSESIDGVLQTITTYIYDGFRVIQERDGNNNNNPLVSYTRGTDLSGTLEGATTTAIGSMTRECKGG